MVEFRTYNESPISTSPLCEGVSPSELTRGQIGDIRFVASSAMMTDGTFNVSLWNQKLGKHYSQIMTKEELTQVYANDGIEVVWVDDLIFGELRRVVE